jgi:uncharacterized OsmC-like protein
VLDRQEPLRRRYHEAPDEARIVERARSVADPDDDPFHATVDPGLIHGEQWRIGINRAVGGFHDLPNPGDVLCAALASCFDTTLRMIAARMQLPLERLAIEIVGEVDVRGTLAVERSVPVGFQHLRCNVELKTPDGVSDATVDRLIAAAERACVVLQTLRNGVRIDLERRPSAAHVTGDTRGASVPAARPTSPGIEAPHSGYTEKEPSDA